MKTSILAAAFGFGLLVSGAAYATEAAAPAATPVAAGDGDRPSPTRRRWRRGRRNAPRRPTRKGLHGKERKKFREKCKKGEK